jgi:hypothetical protein
LVFSLWSPWCCHLWQIKTEEEKRHNCKQRLDKSSSRLWVLHIIVDQEQKMHTPVGSKHKPEESFLIEIYEAVQKGPLKYVKDSAITYGEEEQHKHDILMLSNSC